MPSSKVKNAINNGTKNGIKMELCEPLASSSPSLKGSVGKAVSNGSFKQTYKAYSPSIFFLKSMHMRRTAAGRVAELNLGSIISKSVDRYDTSVAIADKDFVSEFGNSHLLFPARSSHKGTKSSAVMYSVIARCALPNLTSVLTETSRSPMDALAISINGGSHYSGSVSINLKNSSSTSGFKACDPNDGDFKYLDDVKTAGTDAISFEGTMPVLPDGRLYNNYSITFTFGTVGLDPKSYTYKMSFDSSRILHSSGKPTLMHSFNANDAWDLKPDKNQYAYDDGTGVTTYVYMGVPKYFLNKTAITAKQQLQGQSAASLVSQTLALTHADVSFDLASKLVHNKKYTVSDINVRPLPLAGHKTKYDLSFDFPTDVSLVINDPGNSYSYRSVFDSTSAAFDVSYTHARADKSTLPGFRVLEFDKGKSIKNELTLVAPKGVWAYDLTKGKSAAGVLADGDISYQHGTSPAKAVKAADMYVLDASHVRITNLVGLVDPSSVTVTMNLTPPPVGKAVGAKRTVNEYAYYEHTPDLSGGKNKLTKGYDFAVGDSSNVVLIIFDSSYTIWDNTPATLINNVDVNRVNVDMKHVKVDNQGNPPTVDVSFVLDKAALDISLVLHPQSSYLTAVAAAGDVSYNFVVDPRKIFTFPAVPSQPSIMQSASLRSVGADALEIGMSYELHASIPGPEMPTLGSSPADDAAYAAAIGHKFDVSYIDISYYASASPVSVKYPVTCDFLSPLNYSNGYYDMSFTFRVTADAAHDVKYVISNGNVWKTATASDFLQKSQIKAEPAPAIDAASKKSDKVYVIKSSAALSYNHYNSAGAAPSATAAYSDGSKPVAVTASATPSVQSLGAQTITYTATNVVKTDTFTRTLNVVAKPTIALPGSDPSYLLVGDVWKDTYSATVTSVDGAKDRASKVVVTRPAALQEDTAIAQALGPVEDATGKLHKVEYALDLLDLSYVKGHSGDEAVTDISNSRDVVVGDYMVNITGTSGMNYVFGGTGKDKDGAVSGNDPTININKGDVIIFKRSFAGHALSLKYYDGGTPTKHVPAGNGATYGWVSGSGVATNGGALVWKAGEPGMYHYVCDSHADMSGTIMVGSIQSKVSGSVICGHKLTVYDASGAELLSQAATASTDEIVDINLIKRKANYDTLMATRDDDVLLLKASNGTVHENAVGRAKLGDNEDERYLLVEAGDLKKGSLKHLSWTSTVETASILSQYDGSAAVDYAAEYDTADPKIEKILERRYAKDRNKMITKANLLAEREKFSKRVDISMADLKGERDPNDGKNARLKVVEAAVKRDVAAMSAMNASQNPVTVNLTLTLVDNKLYAAGSFQDRSKVHTNATNPPLKVFVGDNIAFDTNDDTLNSVNLRIKPAGGSAINSASSHGTMVGYNQNGLSQTTLTWVPDTIGAYEYFDNAGGGHSTSKGTIHVVANKRERGLGIAEYGKRVNKANVKSTAEGGVKADRTKLFQDVAARVPMKALDRAKIADDMEVTADAYEELLKSADGSNKNKEKLHKAVFEYKDKRETAAEQEARAKSGHRKAGNDTHAKKKATMVADFITKPTGKRGL